jgi:hypothetical protein
MNSGQLLFSFAQATSQATRVNLWEGRFAYELERGLLPEGSALAIGTVWQLRVGARDSFSGAPPGADKKALRPLPGCPHPGEG